MRSIDGLTFSTFSRGSARRRIEEVRMSKSYELVMELAGLFYIWRRL